MKQKSVKKFLAVLTVASMVFAPTSVFAADSTDADAAGAGSDITGDGKLEGYINKDVFRIVLPTIQNVNFTADPQGLLTIGGVSGFGGGPGAVYFTNAPATDGGTATHSDTSDPITVINKSSYELDVKLNVELDTKGVALVSSKDDLETATVPSLYMGLKTDGGAPVAITEATTEKPFKASQKVEGVAEVTNASDKGYIIKASSTAPDPNPDNIKPSPSGQYYSYELTSAFTDADAEKVSYELTAACDKTADWENVNDDMTAKVTWSCAKAAEEPEEVILFAKYFDGEGAYLSVADFTADGGNNAPEGQRGFESAEKGDITGFKVENLECDFNVTDGYILLTDEATIEAGVPSGTWHVEFTYNGKIYKATIE